jgi:hypothetical protein
VVVLGLMAPWKERAEYRRMRAAVISRARHHCLRDQSQTHDYDFLLERDADTLLNKGFGNHELLDALAQWELHDAALFAEAGRSDVEDFWYGPASLARTLTEHGFATPEFQRSRLLCEARRCYDWIYLGRCTRLDANWRQFRQDALTSYPSDPKVQWAAGQLDLSEHIYEPAQAELRRALALAAAQPGGVPAFCRGAGISEQHLRGRLACALTLLGQWDEADQEDELARRAHDGFIAPFPWTLQLADAEGLVQGSSGNELDEFSAQLGELRQNIRQHELVRREAERYAQTRQPQLLDGWQKQLASSRALLHKPSDLTNDQLAAMQSQTALAHEALLRAYLLAHQWDLAVQYNDSSAILSTYYDYWSVEHLDYDLPLRHEATTLLTRLAAGQKLGATVQEELALQAAQANGAPAGDSDSPDSDEPEEAYGELAGLLDADYLLFLLHTTEFAAALQASGRRRDAVLAEIRDVTGYAPIPAKVDPPAGAPGKR